jgi:hypothetical protein
MNRTTRDFVQTTTTRLDELLAQLLQDEQHDLLDALAEKIEERLDRLVLMSDET